MKTLLTEQQLDAGVRRMAAEIARDYGTRPVTIVGVLTGSIVLVADLIRRFEMPMRVGVVQASSYRGSSQRGPMSINADMMPDIRGRDVVLVDDIFDTGHTLVDVISQMNRLGPRSLRSAVLLRKQGRQEVEMTPDYVAFDIPDAFVVGYGLDYRDEYRNLPFVAMLEPHELADGTS